MRWVFGILGGYDVLNGISIFCHYANCTEEKQRESTAYLTELSKRMPVIALPEEDTLFVSGHTVETMGTLPFYHFENGNREKREPGYTYIIK